jgi:CheY-like chemotaxis protein
MTANILLVDDERSIRDSLSKVLRAEGYEVLLAENGQEAIERLAHESIDLLLLDIGLPVKDGWATLGSLTEVNPLLPVILITGRWKQSELAAAAGVDVLMEKPLDVPLLFQIIRELLKEPPAARARRLQDRGRGFRSVSCDAKEFCEQLKRAYTTPYPCGHEFEMGELLHRTGVTITRLRPSGTAFINGKRTDVVTEGGPVDRGASIKVVAVEGPRVIVREV